MHRADEGGPRAADRAGRLRRADAHGRVVAEVLKFTSNADVEFVIG